MSNKGSSHEVLLLLGSGFEDLEAVAVLDVCGWTTYRAHLPRVRVVTAGLHREVRGRFGTTFQVDLLIEDVQPGRFSSLVVPGGFDSHGYGEIYDERVYALARAIHARGAPIVTMCVGVLPIAEAGLLKERRATTYSFSRSQDRRARLRELGAVVTSGPIENDGGIVSCAGPAYAVATALLLLEQVAGPAAAHEIKTLLHG
jgi:4-methyl-5(b-hydroxyethyl)-thiazole monophosphate biosynthesis